MSSEGLDRSCHDANLEERQKYGCALRILSVLDVNIIMSIIDKLRVDDYIVHLSLQMPHNQCFEEYFSLTTEIKPLSPLPCMLLLVIIQSCHHESSFRASVIFIVVVVRPS